MSRYVIKTVDYLGRTLFKEDTSNRFVPNLSIAKHYAYRQNAEKWFQKNSYLVQLRTKDGDNLSIVTEEEAINKQDKRFRALICSEGKVYFNNEEVTDPHLVDLLKEVATYIK